MELDEDFFTVTLKVKVNIEFPMQICRQRVDTRHGNEKIWCESSLIISTSWTETRDGEREREREGGNDRPVSAGWGGAWPLGSATAYSESAEAKFVNAVIIKKLYCWFFVLTTFLYGNWMMKRLLTVLVSEYMTNCYQFLSKLQLYE